MTDVAQAYAYCREVTRRSATSFYNAFRLLPPERRAALGVTSDLCVVLDVQALLALPELVIE